MRTINIDLDLYKFDELEFIPQARAILEHKQYLMREWKFNATSIEAENDINNNLYWFFKDGEKAVTEAEIEKNSITEKLKLQDKEYIIPKTN